MEFILIYIVLGFISVGVAILAYIVNEFYTDFKEFSKKVDNTEFDNFL